MTEAWPTAYSMAYGLQHGLWPTAWPMAYSTAHGLQHGLWPTAWHIPYSMVCGLQYDPQHGPCPMACSMAYGLQHGLQPTAWPTGMALWPARMVPRVPSLVMAYIVMALYSYGPI